MGRSGRARDAVSPVSGGSAQPGPVGRPAGPAPGLAPGAGEDAALPSLTAPRALTAVGCALLVLGLVLFVYSMTSAPSVVASGARDVPTDGTTTSVDLKAEEVYGFYSQDTALRCTATGPDGEAVEVTDPIARSQSKPPQVLSMTTRGAGPYTVSCEGTRAAVLNTAEVSPARRRAENVFVVSGPTIIVGLVSAVAGTVWLVVRRRRRAVAVVSRLQSGLGADAAPAAVRPYGTPWSGQYPVPGQAQQTGQGRRPGQVEQPGRAQRPGTAPAGGYGLAPKQVVYRPSPPSGGSDGNRPRD